MNHGLALVPLAVFVSACASLPTPSPTERAAAPQCAPVVLAARSDSAPSQQLAFPGLLERDALLAGNPLATYAAMRQLERHYRASPIFGQVYPEIRLNFEQFLGFQCAGMQAMSYLRIRGATDSSAVARIDSFAPRPAVDVIAQRAAGTRIVIYGEEHHMPQTRSVFEALLAALWQQGYRYLAAEAFEDTDMSRFVSPDYRSGYYMRDPVFASAVRAAQALGYSLVSYETREQGAGISFRDSVQARNIYDRTFARDPQARVLVIAGRLHAAEIPGADGWTPMAVHLKRITGIDPLTIYAPTMTERLTRPEEDPLYRRAIERGQVPAPAIFERDGRLLGSEAFDAYVFFPRTRLIGGRPDWMVTTLRRRPIPIPANLLSGDGMRLIQAFPSGAPPTTTPQDQVVVDGGTPPVLMLPPGAFRLRSIDAQGKVHAMGEVRAPR